ncbi:MAG: type I-E CRISPR-associated protein Cse1/CasA [Desulfamplus sp.]|nr:type I-E CRISPR-associated protein Cse1/CasA [Desulfamplus sp.]
MKKEPARQFNLVDEDWIPVAGEGKVNLKRIFTDPTLKALGGNPIEKIALTKLLLAIAQAAYTPKSDEDWRELGAKGMAEKALNYLEEKKDCFWLYGDKPFLQMPSINKAQIQSFSAVLPDIATGNTTILIESQVERTLKNDEKARLLVFLSGFALGGKKTDNSVVLTKGYSGKTNDKGKPATAKPGPSIGFLGYLHSFLCGNSICENIWLNLATQQDIKNIGQFNKGVGIPPWERVPEGENCPAAIELKSTLMGRLIPLCRFTLLSDNGMHYSEGIAYPSHKEGGFDLSIAVDFSKKNSKAIWVDPDKRPWRELTSLLSFFSSEGDAKFDCPQLRLSIYRARKAVKQFSIWSGGLKVSSNAGEQFVSGSDDFVESEALLKAEWLGEIWFTKLKQEMEILQEVSKNLYGSTISYFKHQKADGKKQAEQSTHLFWQLSERRFQELIDSCGDTSGNETKAMRYFFIEYANQAYNTFCPRDTARQIDAWAACRPKLSKFMPDLPKNITDHKKESVEQWEQMEMF